MSNITLGRVSWLDCFVFVFFLAPQLILNVGFFPTLFCGLRALPFLLVKLPLSFVYERLILSREQQSPFVRKASWFEDLVIRCVRYAFAYIPSKIGRVFFSKPVVLPFFYFRLWRHGYIRCPIHWHDIKTDVFSGIWTIKDPSQKPDIVLYYAHGGGFSMGTSYFYLEFLLTLLTQLTQLPNKFSNPAILSLEYSLVPDSCYPTQLHEAISGHKFLLYDLGIDAERIVFSGDSAGGTIMLSLLLWIGYKNRENDSSHNHELGKEKGENGKLGVPGMVLLISPWTTLLSPLHTDTKSDYLCVSRLTHYANLYASSHPLNSPIISPGNCKDLSLWRDVSPSKGFYFMYGAEEIFAPEIREMSRLLRKSGSWVGERVEEKGVHVGAVVSLFLGRREERGRGVRDIAVCVGERMGVKMGVNS